MRRHHERNRHHRDQKQQQCLLLQQSSHRCPHCQPNDVGDCVDLEEEDGEDSEGEQDVGDDVNDATLIIVMMRGC